MKPVPDSHASGGPVVARVEDLRVEFPVRRNWRGRPTAVVTAVAGVSFELREGKALGLVGESGCGKSTIGRALLRLEKPTSGRIEICGVDWSTLSPGALREARRNAQMVFQDPYGTLNPRRTIGESIGEALEIHHPEWSAEQRRSRVCELLAQVRLTDDAVDRHPAAFSGGQRQRVGLARALAVDPRILVCDEPVSALDVSVQAQILRLLRELQESRQLALLFISHDLAVVEHLCETVMVMYLGRIVERGETREICARPSHPYSRALIASVPRRNARIEPAQVSGDPPSPLHPPSGCPFHTRCPAAQPRCSQDVPELRFLAGRNREVACHFPLD